MDAGHVSENTYLKKSNKRSDQVATQKNGFCLLFSAKNRIYKQNTHTHTGSGTENSLFRF